MTPEQRDEIRSLILFYDSQGWDLSDVIYYLVWKYHGKARRH